MRNKPLQSLLLLKKKIVNLKEFKMGDPRWRIANETFISDKRIHHVITTPLLSPITSKMLPDIAIKSPAAVKFLRFYVET